VPLIIETSTTAERTLPLPIDPALIAANPVADDGSSALALFVRSGDASRLVVPSDAVMMTMRPLSRPELHDAARMAGEQDAGGADALRRLEGGETLTDADLGAAARHTAWASRWLSEVARRALVRIDLIPAAARRGAYPVEQLAAIVARDHETGAVVFDGLEVIHAIGTIAIHLSSLGTSGKASSGGSSPTPPINTGADSPGRTATGLDALACGMEAS
jgi:hypothetical protein